MIEKKNWQTSPAAPAPALRKVASVSPFPLPESYLEFLSNSNGGEGALGVSPDWLILFPAEEVAEIEENATFHEFFKGYFVIGGSGGGDAIALTANTEGQVNVVAFDMTNIDLKESVVLLAPTFDALIEMLEDREA
ncbi:SMI1 / KNR4 family protein [Thalassovita autumnalis]|uniref:SMI1 / KNR4 family protein n=1 Tax=Thalassovita autumnalis TaxID=2072972 RepID=A0A0P1FR21_9RHOB|nr:SMI1/KNR4 family protein [Thalassovita autumnalis]CUH62517.1 SMI1 / KNR4 family protein [Thalassovita autumnalis]CUH70312.1 SMI1 / KNR4 family protein [Thalassovita autumnalis]